MAAYEACMGDRRSCRILMKLEFSRQIFENTRIKFLMKIRPVRVELSHADGRLDRHQANSRFQQFCIRAQKCTVLERGLDSSRTV